jgi:PLP dependent protein
MRLPDESLMCFNKQLIEDILARDITLVAVTKNKPALAIIELIKLGVRNIGENKVQEFEEKYEQVKTFLDEQSDDVKFHFIGHLQSNKAVKAVEIFDVIQSIDSLKIAEKVNEASEQLNKRMDVMIQVNIGREEQKYGVNPEKVSEFYEQIKNLSNINIIGLMCIAPNVDAEKTRVYFQEMKELKEKLNLKELSMGMTNDYWVAMEEGSTMLRLGRILYKGFDYCCSG